MDLYSTMAWRMLAFFFSLTIITFESKARIRRFELHPGDTLIIGSDGRDDLEIAGTVDSDENRFLRIVEQTHGDIQQVPDQLDQRGRRTDDLSLVAITYRNATL